MKNSDYWKERFEQLNESLLNKGEEYYKSLDKEYRKAMNTIELQINNWYMRIANNNEISMAEAKKWLREKELEEFQWTVEEYIEKGKTLKYSDEWMTELENASARVHIRRLEALEIQLKQTVEELYQRQYEELSERLKAIYEEGYYHTAFEVQKGFNVGWSIPALDSNRVEKVVSKPWTSDGINFSDRIWKAKDDLINILHTELTQSIIMGKAPDQAIAKIAKKFNTSKTRAGRLIMTESAFFASVSQKDCFNELGVEEYKVCATLDLRTSEICRDMDGKVFKMSDYEPGITAPPFHCWCRTTTIPYFEDNVGERIARSSDGKSYYVPNNMTYREWYEKYVKSNPDELLAEKKYQNRHADKKQHASYKKVLGKEVPSSLDAFQNLKYTDDKKWEGLKGQFKAENVFNRIVQESANLHIKGIPIKNIQRINIEQFEYAEVHINSERLHGVTKFMAQQFINEAQVAYSRWNGQVTVYVSQKGCTVVNLSKKTVSTAYRSEEYDEKFKKILEAVDNDKMSDS